MTAPTVKKTRPFWRFDAIEDDRTSEICSGINGTILPVDDSFWSDHVPPLHFNCRSQLVPLDLEDVDDEGGADDEAPEIDADEGFGAAPTKEGEDWKPDPDDYPGPIGDELRSRLR
jgi:uncharacterized protein with gpF-like domain